MELEEFLSEWNNAENVIRVHTSGSTGKPKEMLVEKRRMLASAKITCDFLNLKEGDSALLCMPLDFIAGKMMIVRSIERNLNLTTIKPSNHPLANTATAFDLVAMVPSQVYGSLQIPEEKEKLKSIRNLIIGGGSISAEIEAELKTFPNAVWSTYGMTETLSHIALRRINGENTSAWYTPFEGVGIRIIEAENNEGNIGQLVISAPHVCASTLVTNDIVEINKEDYLDQNKSAKRFRIIGRKDNVICSGGIKLHIEEIEDLLRQNISSLFCVSKRADKKFGEAAILLVEKDNNNSENITQETLMQICKQTLPAYSVPKDIIFVQKIPLTGTGKIDRASAATLASAIIS